MEPINFQMIQFIVTIITALVVPVVALYVRSTVGSTVDLAIKKTDERFTAFELKMSESLGQYRTHMRESEIRHDTNERRIAILESHWDNIQQRANQQQIFEKEIASAQDAIAKTILDIAKVIRKEA
jgi:hypothetical protein